MFEVINKQILAENVKRIDILAPNIARKIQPGQFVSVCPEEEDERIPLTVVESDLKKGTISLIVQEVGQTTGNLGALPINESVYSVLGPLGKPTKIEKVGVVLCIATGIGIAQILPICRAYKKAGNKVISIIGAKTRRGLMLEPQMRLACNKVILSTDDGSYDRRGLATDILRNFVNEQKINLVYAIGSADMMRKTCLITKEKKIKTLVQLKPVMVDCMGMCGSCRVKINGKMVMACIEGPEFDGHKVDFDDFILRKKAFEELEGCYDQKLQSNLKKSESGTLMKYLLGFLKR